MQYRCVSLNITNVITKLNCTVPVYICEYKQSSNQSQNYLCDLSIMFIFLCTVLIFKDSSIRELGEDASIVHN